MLAKRKFGILVLFLMATIILLNLGCVREKQGEITGTGTIEMTEVSVSNKVGGKLLKVIVGEGQTVKSGELVAELDHQELDARIVAARSSLEVNQANRQAARRDFERMRQLFQAQVISKSQYDGALTSLDVAEAQVKKSQADLDLLGIQLKDYFITAPANGIVSARMVEPGEIIAAGTSLFTILDNTRPWVKIYLPLTDVEKVSLNQKASIMMDAFPDRKFTGRVSNIASEAEFTPKDYLSKEERVKKVFAVKVELKNEAGLLKAGLPVDVTIEKDKD